MKIAASHLGLFCLPMCHKKDARLKRVKENIESFSLINCIFYKYIQQDTNKPITELEGL